MSAARSPAVMSYAEAAVLALTLEMQADPNVVVLGEDVGRGGIFGQYKGLQGRLGARESSTRPSARPRSWAPAWAWL